MTLDLLDNVFLLHLALETAQSVFEGFTLLQSYFCQMRYTPKLVRWDPLVITRFRKQVKGEVKIILEMGFCCGMTQDWIGGLF